MMTTPSKDALKELLQTGKTNYEQKNYDEAKKAYHQALAMSQKMKEPDAEVVCLYMLGIIYDEQKHYQKAIHYYEKAKDIYHHQNRITDEARVYYLIGKTWDNLRHRDVAIPLLRKAVELYPASERTSERVNLLMKLGICLGETYIPEQMREGLVYLEEARAINQEISEDGDLLYDLIFISRLYSRLDEHEKAIALAKEAITHSQEKGEKNAERVALGDLGHFYLAMGDSVNAISYLEQAIAVTREMKESNQLTLGVVIFHLADALHHKANQPNKALIHYEEAALIFKSVKNNHELGRCYFAMSEIYEGMEKFVTADEYAKQARIASETAHPNNFIIKGYDAIMGFLGKFKILRIYRHED